MSGVMTRKRLREDEQRRKDEEKKPKVVNNVSQSSERTTADLARQNFIDRLLGSVKIEDEEDYCNHLDRNLFPAHNALGACKGIEPNDLFVLNGAATSRSLLRGWVETFKDKSVMPTDPLNRHELTNDDLISLGFSPNDFLAIRQQAVQSAQTSSVSSLSAPSVIDLRKPHTFDNISDNDFAVAIITSFYQNTIPPSFEQVAERIKKGKCFTLLLAYDAFYASENVAVPLWMFLSRVIGDIDLIFWLPCLSEIYINNTEVEKVQKAVKNLQARRVKPFLHILESLFSGDAFTQIFNFVLAFDSFMPKSKNHFKDLVETTTNVVLRISAELVPVQVAGILIGVSLQWLLPISHLVAQFYDKLSQEPAKKALVYIWSKVAQYDKFKQSTILVAYFCHLPQTFLVEFVRIAINHRSNECANYYYEQLADEADRFFALKLAIDFGNSDFLQNKCSRFNSTVSSVHNSRVLLAIAAENGDLDVVRPVLKNQQVSIGVWCNLLVSVPSSNFDTFLYLWNLGFEKFQKHFDNSDDVHDAILTLCRIGHLEKLKYWISNSSANLFELLHERLLLECCSSPFAKLFFDYLISHCKKQFGRHFSPFFSNGALLIRAASRGRDLIVKELLPKLYRTADMPSYIVDSIITASFVTATKGSKRTTFFVLWEFIGASVEQIPPFSRDEIFAAGRACQDDFIKEALQLITRQQ